MLKKILILIFLSLNLYALDFASMNKSAKVNISTISGTSNEIVYNSDGSKLSELFWRLDNVTLIGVNAAIQPNDRVVVNLDFKKNLENPSSTMDDYDWMDGYTTSPAGYTHWSHHENTTVKDVTKIDLNLQAALIPTKLGVLYGMVGYKKDTFKWEAKGGFYEYSTNNFNRVYIDDDTKVISYSQYITTVYFGAGVVYTDLADLKIDANFKFATNVSIRGEDMHHQRTDYGANGIYFVDECDEATLTEWNISIMYDIQKNFSIYLGYNFTDISIAKGYTTADYINTPYYSVSSNGTAGASHESTMYTLGVKFNF